MPVRYDSTASFDSGFVYNSVAGVGAGIPVYDTLLTFDGIQPYDRMGQAYNAPDVYDNPNIQYDDGPAQPYNADRTYDSPSPWDWPPQ